MIWGLGSSKIKEWSDPQGKGNRETLLWDFGFRQVCSCNTRQKILMKKGRGGHTLVSFFASSSQIWREDCSLKSSPSSLFRLWSAIVYFSLFVFSLCSWPLAHSSCPEWVWHCNRTCLCFQFQEIPVWVGIRFICSEATLVCIFFYQKRRMILLIMAVPFRTHCPQSASSSLSQRERNNHNCIFCFYSSILYKKKLVDTNLRSFCYSCVKFVKETSLWSGSGHSYQLFSVVSTQKYS